MGGSGDVAEGVMAARFGNVIYWFCALVGLPLILIGAWQLVARSIQPTDYFDAAFLGGLGLTVLLIGRAFRYVLAGR